MALGMTRKEYSVPHVRYLCSVPLVMQTLVFLMGVFLDGRPRDSPQNQGLSPY